MSAYALKTSDLAGKNLREDLLDVITDLSPMETPLVSGLSKSRAHQSIHEWVNMTTARASSVSSLAEGGDVTFANLDVPTRGHNYVQEIVMPYKVSTKMQDSVAAGMPNPLAFYRARAMKMWKMSLEYALIWGTGNSGASGSSWEMTGFKKALTTNYISFASGTTITEARFNDILQLAYADVTDDTFECYSGIGLKRAISAFTAGATKFHDMEDRRLINAVDVYQSDVAKMVKLFGHRDIPTATTTTNWLMAIQPKAFSIAYLHNPEDKSVAVSGPYEAGYIYGSATLEYRQEAAGVRAENLFVA